MDISIHHTFENFHDITDEVTSKKFLKDKSAWILSVSRKEVDMIDMVVVDVSVVPHHVRAIKDWSMTLDFHSDVNGVLYEEEEITLKAKNSLTIFQQPYSRLCERESELGHSSISLQITISNMTTQGIRSLPFINFRTRNLDGVDLSLTIKGRSLYCHKATLKRHSSVFKELIEEQERRSRRPFPGYAFFLNIHHVDLGLLEVPPPTINTNIDLDIGYDITYKDFEQFLYLLYICEDEVYENNVEKILRIADTYDVPIIKYYCQNFLQNYEGTGLSADTIVLYVWRFNLKLYKDKCLERIDSYTQFCSMFHNKLYVEMTEDAKLELLEAFILRKAKA